MLLKQMLLKQMLLKQIAIEADAIEADTIEILEEPLQEESVIAAVDLDEGVVEAIATVDNSLPDGIEPTEHQETEPQETEHPETALQEAEHQETEPQETKYRGPETIESAEPEIDAADIDESVMSAFDIGDFEADSHAVKDELEKDGRPQEGTSEPSDTESGHASSSDFDPDELEVDDFDLAGFDLDALDLPDENASDAEERLSTADISLDEISEKRRGNFAFRWFQKWLTPEAAERDAAEPVEEPKLFETDYVQSAEAEVANGLFAPEDNDAAADPTIDLDGELFLSADELITDSSDVEETTEESEQPDSHTLDSETDWTEDALKSDEDALADETISESISDETILPLHDADDVPTTEEVLSLSLADDLFEPESVELDEGDESEDDSLLEPLGEKSWLSEADNANEALHTAAAAGDLSGVWAALEANASVNALSKTQRTALSVAIEAGHIPVVEMLLEMCADPNQADIVNGSPVRYPLMVAASDAAEPSRGELLRSLLAKGADVNQTNMMGQTALMEAAEHGHVEAMRRLMEANANLDTQDLLGRSALLLARANKHESAIALLQETALERERAIAFLKAVTRGDLAEVQQWLDAGMSANTRVARMSALTQAAARGEIAIAKLLIEAGADVDYRFYETDPTPLFHAAYRGQGEMVSLLLEAGANTHPNAVNAIGALDYAEIGQQKAGNAVDFEPVIELLATLAIRPD